MKAKHAAKDSVLRLKSSRRAHEDHDVFRDLRTAVVFPDCIAVRVPETLLRPTKVVLAHDRLTTGALTLFTVFIVVDSFFPTLDLLPEMVEEEKAENLLTIEAGLLAHRTLGEDLGLSEADVIQRLRPEI